MNSVRSKYLRWKHLRCSLSDYKDIRISKFEFVARTQFLSPTVAGKTAENAKM